MYLGEFLKSPQSWANPEVVDATFYEDFIYRRETKMLTRDEFIQHLETDFVNGPHFNRRQNSLRRRKKGASEHIVLHPVSKRKALFFASKRWENLAANDDLGRD